jgi:hypothetical protein
MMKVCINPLGIAGLIAIAWICIFPPQIAFAQNQPDSSHAAYLDAAIEYCNSQTQVDKNFCISDYRQIAPYCTLADTNSTSPLYENCKIGPAPGTSSSAATPCRAPSNRDGTCEDEDTTFPGNEQ